MTQPFYIGVSSDFHTDIPGALETVLARILDPLPLVPGPTTTRRRMGRSPLRPLPTATGCLCWHPTSGPKPTAAATRWQSSRAGVWATTVSTLPRVRPTMWCWRLPWTQCAARWQNLSGKVSASGLITSLMLLNLVKLILRSPNAITS